MGNSASCCCERQAVEKVEDTALYPAAKVDALDQGKPAVIRYWETYQGQEAKLTEVLQQWGSMALPRIEYTEEWQVDADGNVTNI